MAINYAPFDYPVSIPVTQPSKVTRFEIEGLHFIILYIFTLFILTFSK